MNDTISPDAETGLRAGRVAQKRAQGRQNVLDDRATKSTAQILKDNVCTLFNLFNLRIAAALALVGAWSNLLFLLVVALNTLIGIAQEIHASASRSCPCRRRGSSATAGPRRSPHRTWSRRT